MDLNIKDLDDAVGARLKEQASAAGMSVQAYLRAELTRIAARPSPDEFIRQYAPMTRDEFEEIRDKLRSSDAA
jgi:plasmid stability protein